MYLTYIIGSMIYASSAISPLMTSTGLVQAAGIGGFLIMSLSAGIMRPASSTLGPGLFKLPEQRKEQERCDNKHLVYNKNGVKQIKKFVLK